MRSCFLLFVASLLLGGCASTDGPLVSNLTQAQVKEIATARLRENRITLSPAASWKMSLSADGNPPVWTVMPQETGSPPPGYWLLVEDRMGGKADFIAPQLGAIKPPAGSDWLYSVQSGLKRIKFPIGLEALLAELHLEGVNFGSGGSTPEGKLFIDGTLRWIKEGTPERFDLRCYIITPDGWTGRKIVTSAELSYTDNLINRYLVVDGNN